MAHPDHEKNRTAWNEMAEVHFRHPDYKVEQFLNGKCTLHSIEQEVLGDVSGKQMLHLMCQFGLDSLSWVRRRALVTGVDISDKSIEYANRLKEQAGLKATFIRCDVLDLIGRIKQQFDIVFQSYGTLCWISDLSRWAQVVAHYLKPGGTFLIIDGHPMEWVFMDEKHSYFATEPDRSSGDRDYCDRNYVIRGELVEWQHKLSDIINALFGAGLTIEWLEEYEFSYYPVFEDWREHPDKPNYWHPPGGPTRFPLMFALKSSKPLI